jgi:hypothetical protein
LAWLLSVHCGVFKERVTRTSQARQFASMTPIRCRSRAMAAALLANSWSPRLRQPDPA